MRVRPTKLLSGSSGCDAQLLRAAGKVEAANTSVGIAPESPEEAEWQKAVGYGLDLVPGVCQRGQPDTVAHAFITLTLAHSLPDLSPK